MDTERKIQDLERRLRILEGFLDAIDSHERYTFQKDVELLPGRNIITAGATGTKIGTAATQRLGFWGKSPAVQPAAVSNPTGGATIDTEMRTSYGTLLSRLRVIGIIAE
jgi:hypothetical protein